MNVYGLLPDSPTRVGAPDESGPRPFSELPEREQLDIIETICRREPYMSALKEALQKSRQSASLLHMALDIGCPDAVIGQLVRQMIRDYIEGVATQRGDDLAEFV